MACDQLLLKTLETFDKRYMPIETTENIQIGLFEGQRVTVKQKPNKHFTLDTMYLDSGSGKGKKFYNMVWDWADSVGGTYDIIPYQLSTVNQYRLAANVLDRFKTHPETTSIKKGAAKRLIDNAIKELNLDLQFEGSRQTVKTLNDDEIELFGDIFGSDTNKRIGARSLRAFKDYANGKITIGALLGIIVPESEKLDGN